MKMIPKHMNWLGSNPYFQKAEFEDGPPDVHYTCTHVYDCITIGFGGRQGREREREAKSAAMPGPTANIYPYTPVV